MEPQPSPVDGGFATRAVHAALGLPAPGQQSVAPAIWPAATWSVPASEDLADLLEDRVDGYVYGRYDNPTNTALHAAIASLHGAEAAWSLASGTAAIHAVLATLRDGRGVLATERLYGGTYALLERQRRDAGWTVDYAHVSDADVLADVLDPDRHGVVHVETIANPSTTVADLAALARVCADAGVALSVDNTFASPYLCRPLELGASVVVESATKLLAGHGDVVAGVVAGDLRTVRRIRSFAYEQGAALGPFEAWLVARGIQTLPLRLRAACANAAAVAELLAADDTVVQVGYPGLTSHPQHELAKAQFGGRGAGAVLSCDLGSSARAEAFADATRVILRAVSLGSTQSLILHPASTSHRQLSDAELAAAGITVGTVRLSLGIEDTADLTADVARALSVAATISEP